MHKYINIIKKQLGNSTDIVIREFNNISYIYLESVCSDDKISNFLNKGILNSKNIESLYLSLNNNIYNSHVNTSTNIEEAFYYLSSGYTCVFIENMDKYIVVETKASLDRGITESTTEPIIRGPKDSFTENHSINIGLIRKRIKSRDLRIKDILVGEYTSTKISLIYIDDIADIRKVNKIKKTIKKIKINGIIDSGYLKEYFSVNNTSSFPKVISSERPDLACQNLLTGKIVILVENSPICLILPAVLIDFFKISEDYYHKSINSSFTRLLRFIAFFVSIYTPALYVALMTFNQEIIPEKLLMSLASNRAQIPFPTFIEVMIFIIIFEILREADVRSPSVAGASMSIVGALVLGDAAVSAGLVSPIVIIVVAITSICELIFSDIDMANAIRQWRLIFIFSTLFTGIIGILSASLLLITKLASIEILNTPYLSPVSPYKKELLNDSFIIKKIFNRNNNTIKKEGMQ